MEPLRSQLAPKSATKSTQGREHRWTRRLVQYAVLWARSGCRPFTPPKTTRPVEGSASRKKGRFRKGRLPVRSVLDRFTKSSRTFTVPTLSSLQNRTFARNCERHSG